MNSIQKLFRIFIFIIIYIAIYFSYAKADDWLTEFISQLDSQSEPVQELHQLGLKSTRDEKIKILANYFRKKEFLYPNWVISIAETKDPNINVKLADEATKHLITSWYGQEQFGDNLPWFSSEKELVTIARFPYFDQLVPAYYHTGNEKYAQAIVGDMVDFMDNAPISKAEKYHVQIDAKTNPWNWVLLQWRVMRWIDALSIIKESPSIPDSTYLRIIHHIWQEVDWLVPRMVLGLHNGTLGNVRTILYAGFNFPEAANSKEWLDVGINFFRFFLELAFYPGEILVEGTLGYSEGTLFMCLGIFEGLPDTELKEKIRKPLEKLVDGHIGLMKPDRSLPRYGDHGVFNLRERMLLKAGRLFNRADFINLAQEDYSSKASPSYLSYPPNSKPFYISGYYAMRDGWEWDAQYLSMDAGPYGTNHQHADKLSITVSADGADFIVDPGTSIYKSTEPGIKYDLRFGFLHNVITIDGVDPNTGWDRHYAFDVLDNRWITNPKYDFLEGTYEYRNNLLDIIARRTVFYKRGEYWLIFDALKGSGKHNIESNFQFMKDTQIDIEENSIIATATNGATLHLASVSDGLTPTIIIGDTTFQRTTYPTGYPQHVDWKFAGRGWLGTFGNESKINPAKSHPAPALLFTGSIELPHYSVRVLSPSEDKKPQPIKVSWLDKTDDHFSIKIEHLSSIKSTIDIFDWHPMRKPKTHKPLGHENGFWLRYVDEQLEEIVVMNRKKIQYTKDKSILNLQFSESVEGYLTQDNKGWSIYIDKYIDEPIQIIEFSINEQIQTKYFYDRTKKSNLNLIDENNKKVDYLKPGLLYHFQMN